MVLLKRQIPLVIAFGVGLAMLVQYYIPHSASQQLLTDVSKWGTIIAGFALVIGLSSLLHSHVGKIRRQVPGWGFSVVVVVALAATVTIGIISRSSTKEGHWDGIQWIFDNMYIPLTMTMFSILAFFIASAAYRAFRARTVEATVLLIAAMIIMLEVIPATFFNWIGIPQITGWILGCPNMAAMRGIKMGVALAIVATSLRIIFGIERTYLGGGD